MAEPKIDGPKVAGIIRQIGELVSGYAEVRGRYRENLASGKYRPEGAGAYFDRELLASFSRSIVKESELLRATLQPHWYGFERPD